MLNVSSVNSVQYPVVSFKANSPYAGMPIDRQQYDSYVMSQQMQKQNSKDKWQKAGTLASIGLAAAFITIAITSIASHKFNVKQFKAIEAEKAAEKAKKGASEADVKKISEQLEDLQADKKIVDPTNESIDEDFRKFIGEVQLSADFPKEFIEYIGEDATSNMIIIQGRSGYGKTYDADVLAKALGAKRLKRQFTYYSSKYVGETASNVTMDGNAIERYLKEHPDERVCMVLDESDSLMTPIEHIRSEDNHLKETRSALLNCIDQLRRYPNFFMIATTNAELEAGKIDEAVMRRFAYNMTIKAPNRAAQVASHKSQLKGFKPAENVYSDSDFIKYIDTLVGKGAGHGDTENIVKAVKTKWKAKIMKEAMDKGILDKTTKKCTDKEAFKKLIEGNPVTAQDFNEALNDIGKLAIETRTATRVS